MRSEKEWGPGQRRPVNHYKDLGSYCGYIVIVLKCIHIVNVYDDLVLVIEKLSAS